MLCPISLASVWFNEPSGDLSSRLAETSCYFPSSRVPVSSRFLASPETGPVCDPINPFRSQRGVYFYSIIALSYTRVRVNRKAKRGSREENWALVDSPVDSLALGWERLG